MAVSKTTAGASVQAPKPRTMRQGDTGNDVKALQNQLNQLGLNVGDADGKLGAKTTEAIKSFQSTHGLNPDGKVGPATLGAIATAVAAKTAAPAAPAKTDTGKVSAAASAAAAAGTAAAAATVLNYPTKPMSRYEQQKASAGGLMSQLAENAKIAAITTNPIFMPAALAICAKAQARAIDRYENEVPQKDYSVIMGEESAKANKAILALPGVYAQAGADGLHAVENAALTVAGVVGNAASTAWNATTSAVSSAYDATADFASRAATTAQDLGGRAVDGTVQAAKFVWHVDTAPVRFVGRGMAALGRFFSGVGN